MNRIAKLLSAAVLALGLSQSATASPFYYAGPSAFNVDNSSVSNVTFNIAGGGTITDLNVSINLLGAYGPEGFPGNNNIWLSHAGTTVLLFASTGVYGEAAGGLMDILFDDSALLPSPSTPSFVGTFRAVELLSAFNGLSLAGDWTLSIQDPTIFPGEGDDLISWSLSGEVPEPATLALFGLGLASVSLLRRRKIA